ncbi:hypothetical protein CDL15_Pgr023897 [Punica granatum]|uniref:Uncharacterized protein n=1 Tax=Punica granatum TaxID=22663 RepID=A0A218XX06_PUNGR|nr:hypothetical protein CDL15_Pgr023897 [Punica granatum]PKI52629.1 hypothetical protein CRG98_026969 [Punica granatum]
MEENLLKRPYPETDDHSPPEPVSNKRRNIADVLVAACSSTVTLFPRSSDDQKKDEPEKTEEEEGGWMPSLDWISIFLEDPEFAHERQDNVTEHARSPKRSLGLLVAAQESWKRLVALFDDFDREWLSQKIEFQTESDVDKDVPVSERKIDVIWNCPAGFGSRAPTGPRLVGMFPSCEAKVVKDNFRNNEFLDNKSILIE